MRIKCITIDDEPLVLRLISGYIKQFPFLELVGMFERNSVDLWYYLQLASAYQRYLPFARLRAGFDQR